ncbi:MAG: DUF2065 domain-containing protein [Deltaproteobacteria bacterium]|nr:DUF2065 domain-containing protein [Deltaproteobacteria bacterium]
MDFKYLLCVLGLVLIIEGLPYFAFAHKMKTWLRRFLEVPDTTLRVFGFLFMAMGLLLVYLGRT